MMENKRTLAEHLKKKTYSLRLPTFVMEGINRYAELSNEQTSDIIRSCLTDFVNNKTLTNTYLNIKPVTIEIPIKKMDKTEHNLINARYGEKEIITINKVPNNLDEFDKEYGFNSNLEHSGIDHSGIDFIVLPTAYNYKTFDVMNTLYIFYFVSNSVGNIERINLISETEAINRLTAAGDEKTKGRLFFCIGELKKLESEIRRTKNKGLAEIYNTDVEYHKLNQIAKKYNSKVINLLSDEVNNTELSNDQEIVENLDESEDVQLKEEYEKLKKENERLTEIIDNELKSFSEEYDNLNKRIIELEKKGIIVDKLNSDNVIYTNK